MATEKKQPSEDEIAAQTIIKSIQNGNVCRYVSPNPIPTFFPFVQKANANFVMVRDGNLLYFFDRTNKEQVNEVYKSLSYKIRKATEDLETSTAGMDELEKHLPFTRTTKKAKA